MLLRIAARASATVTSTAGTSTVAPRLQIPDCRVPMSPAVGPVSPGLLLTQSAVSVPGPTPDPAQSLTDELVTQQYPSLPGSRTSTSTYGFLSIDTNDVMSASLGAAAAVPRLGRQLWSGLSRSICQSCRSHDCHQSSSRRIVFGRISM